MKWETPWLIQVQPVQCYGFNDGIAEAFATGGTTPYTFVWDSVNGQLNDSAFILTPGIHTVYVTDANGCTSSDTVIITEPTQLEIIIDDTMTVYSDTSFDSKIHILDSIKIVIHEN